MRKAGQSLGKGKLRITKTGKQVRRKLEKKMAILMMVLRGNAIDVSRSVLTALSVAVVHVVYISSQLVQKGKLLKNLEERGQGPSLKSGCIPRLSSRL